MGFAHPPKSSASLRDPFKHVDEVRVLVIPVSHPRVAHGRTEGHAAHALYLFYIYFM